MKVLIIGVGKVGATIAFSLLHISKIEKIYLMDIDQKRLEGENIDLTQASWVLRDISSTEIVEYGKIPNDIDAIIIVAGKARTYPHEDIYQENRKIIESIVNMIPDKLKNNTFIVTNPSDKLGSEFNLLALGNLHRTFGDCSEILLKKGYTNWGIAAEVEKTIHEMTTHYKLDMFCKECCYPIEECKCASRRDKSF